MALFNKDKELFSYDIIREGEDIILKVNCETYNKAPSLEDDPICVYEDQGCIESFPDFQRPGHRIT